VGVKTSRKYPVSDEAVPSACSGTGQRLRVCLAGSGGGHVRQLLDLRPVWEEHDSFFVTEDTALGRSLAIDHRTHFVPHYALGQARLGRTGAMVRAAFANVLQSARIIAAERPDVVLTTGAGAVYFAVLFARLGAAKVFLIDSFARFEAPSKFARMVAPIAHHRIVQSKALANAFRNVRVFDPLRLIDGPRPTKEPLMFATVGATLPFDRLVETVADAKAKGLIPERIVAQVGVGGCVPPGFERVVEELQFDEVQRILRIADLVVCHGGTGSLITALREGCRVVAVPRRFALGEHYDDHQCEVTAAFQQRGLITVARDSEDFAEALERARQCEPVRAALDPTELMDYLISALAPVKPRRRTRADQA
jgi:UDP-N-acetylglucosamine transferase subunit ALG13